MQTTITIETKVTIDLPKFFKTKYSSNNYYMTTGAESAIEVTDLDFTESLILFPRIQGTCIRYIAFIQNGVEEISEAEFKSAFTRVSMRLEEMMN